MHKYMCCRTSMLSSEKREKKISLSLLGKQYLSESSVAWGADWWFYGREEGKQSVVKPVFLQLTVATDPSFLPPSVRFFFFYQFSSLQDWNVHVVHYSLETIRDSLRMNEEDLLNHLLRRWSVTDQTFIQFYGWEWKTVITQRKPVWTGGFVFTFVARGKIKGVVSFDCGFGGYLIFPMNQKVLDLLRLFLSLAVKGVHIIFLQLPLWSFSTGVDSFFNYLLFVCSIVCSCCCWSVSNHPYWCTNTTIPHELQLAFCFGTVYFPLTSQWTMSQYLLLLWCIARLQMVL